MRVTVEPAKRLRGTLAVPGDKSIGHRALLFGALAEGTTHVDGIPGGEDVASTRRCLEALGVATRDTGEDALAIEGRAGEFSAPHERLDCGNSGTTMRLLAGILAGRALDATLDGDASLRARPMRRIAEPLRAMGARIELDGENGDRAPMRVHGSAALKALDYALPVASAQVKSALLLAALAARGTTTLAGALNSRDHTERMLPVFGARLARRNGTLTIDGGQRLLAADIIVPGDVSSAAFWIAAASIVPNSRVVIENVGLNPTRTGFLDVLQRMGAGLDIRLEREDPEPIGTLVASTSRLTATDVEPHEIPALIDELPLLAVVAAFAEGTTRVRGAEELRHKESDRIDAVVANGRAMGMQIDETSDGFAVHGHGHGAKNLHGAQLDARGDHRIAMAFAIAALAAEGPTQIDGAKSAAVSYPQFFSTLESLRDA
ncbi:MAG: 3-phosphoshikimate 1-carboxyvinyltransferase [Candidatus Eremiobacteraeota bacterium]|nr:3-phosphoshikimate 1-carboxyvinyltransferase [Candidatus Eremiobacteraeota bacterium]